MNKKLLKAVFMFVGASVAVDEAGINQSTLLTREELDDLGHALSKITIIDYPDSEAVKVAIETFQETAREVIRFGKPQAENQS